MMHYELKRGEMITTNVESVNKTEYAEAKRSLQQSSRDGQKGKPTVNQH